MLGSREDAEDALQQSFASAFRALPGNDRPAQLKAWLYTIARNHSLTILRARRERPSDEIEQVSFDGISEEVERRAELKHLLADVHDLPEKQRAALVLAEVSDLSHIQVSEVLDCEAKQVKALVFQARTALLQSREARETPCAAIREEIANATGAGLRRGHLRRHVRSCEGCAEFEREVRAQRAMLAVALPVIPSLGLKDAALAAMGIGGGGAAGGGVAGGGGGLIAALGASSAGKIAAVAIATGGAIGGVAATEPGVFRSATGAVAQAATTVSQAASGGVDREQAEKKAASAQVAAENAARAEQAKGRPHESSPNGAAAERRAHGGQPARRPDVVGSPSPQQRATSGGSGPRRSQPSPPGRAQAPRGANASGGASRARGSRGAGPGTRRSGRSEGRPAGPGRGRGPGRVLKSVRPAGARRVVPARRGAQGRSQGPALVPRDPGGPRR